MADPQIQYATTADGVSIAYYAMGEGPPIVMTSIIYYSHLLLGRRMPSMIGALERRHRFVRYSGRGSGLSQREPTDFSLAARLLDLEAVVDRLGLERFALFGPTHGGLAAVAYAVLHPERVTHLILVNAYACGKEFYASSPALRAFASMREITKDQWESYTLTVASWEVEFADSDRAKELAALSRASLEPDAALAFNDASAELDVTDLLPRIRMPTLLLSRPSQGFAYFQSSQVLASRIPDARLVVLEPSTLGGPSLGADGLRAIGEFLGDAAPADEAGEAPRAAAAPRDGASAFRTILFTDIVGHTEMMQRLGDDLGRAVLREHERITRETLKQHDGIEVKTDGDSFMASFTSATKAVECAMALQRAFAHYSESGEPIVVRMGLNIGEPIEEGGPDGRADFFGSAVILGARIKDQAGGGEILVPEAVRHLLSGKNFVFADRGKMLLKGFEEAVRLYEVSWRADASP